MMRFKVTKSLYGAYVWKRQVWPFPSVNGQQTPQSKALQADKRQHSSIPFDLNQCEDALL